MKAPNLGNVDARYPGRERPLLRNLRFAGAHPLAEWGDQFVLRLRKPFGNTRKAAPKVESSHPLKKAGCTEQAWRREGVFAR